MSPVKFPAYSRVTVWHTPGSLYRQLLLHLSFLPHIRSSFTSTTQLKKYGDLSTSRKSKLPLFGRAGKVNVGYDVWKFSSKFSSIGML